MRCSHSGHAMSAYMLQLASWFDLQFSPRTPPAEEDPITQAAWNYPVNQPAEWPWQTAVNPLNPDPTPPPPNTGLDVTLSTGPDGKSHLLGGASMLAKADQDSGAHALAVSRPLV